MTRKHHRTPGSRLYKDYTKNNLANCLKAINNGLPHRKAAKEYGIPRSTISNKISGKCSLSVGGQPTFSPDEEAMFVKCVVAMCDYGFPVNEEDLRHIVKNYLGKVGRTVDRFKDNYPGRDWTKSFLIRHPDLSERFVPNIKKSRAAITPDVLTEYINNLAKLTANVPPENIWNYDETNLTDDPGSRKCIVKRGVKYPGNIMNSSKSSISIMIAGNAAGKLLPPYVVYKSAKLWTTWIDNGLKGTRYNHSSSGWFDGPIFEDCFEFHALPTLKKLEGRKVLIGDNVSSHFSPRVIELCESNDIHFACLPPNSTHLTQPLDVAFFGPMKRNWRKLLRDYKEKSSSSATTLQKHHFPGLLKKLMESLEENQQTTLKAGFKKCGIYPTSVQPLLDSIGSVQRCPELIEDSFKDFLDSKRAVVVGDGTQKRRKKFNIPAGSSITAEDIAKLKVKSEKAPGETAKKVSNKRQKLTNEGGSSTSKRRKKMNIQTGDLLTVKSGESKVEMMNLQIKQEEMPQKEVRSIVAEEMVKLQVQMDGKTQTGARKVVSKRKKRMDEDECSTPKIRKKVTTRSGILMAKDHDNKVELANLQVKVDTGVKNMTNKPQKRMNVAAGSTPKLGKKINNRSVCSLTMKDDDKENELRS